jgi:subtilisin family serine protease
MLLSTVGTVTWAGVQQQAVVGEYIMQSSLRGNIMQALASTGLHVAGLRDLGYGYYQLYDYLDPAQSVYNWSLSHRGYATSLGLNRPVHATALPTEMAGGNSNNFWYYNNTGQVVAATAGDISLGIPATQAGKPGADIDAVRAWDLATGNINTIVAVLDTGLDLANPEFANRIWSNPRDAWTAGTVVPAPGVAPGDGLDNELDGVIDDFHGANFSGEGDVWNPNDIINGHGTLVSGLIAAQGNGGGANVGVNWATQILPVKVLQSSGTGTTATILAGINYVIMLKSLRGVNITAINMSLGGQFIGPPSGVGDPTVAAIFNAIDRAGQVGIITVVAAGNDGLSLDSNNFYPANHSNQLMLTVAATDNRDNPSIFTNFGNHAALAAPGQSIAGIGPDNGGSGTSFAAPLVTGAVALLHSLVPNASQGQIVDAILKGVDVVPQLAGYVSTSGRLNVFKSMEILMGDVPLRGHVDSISSTSISGWLYDGNVGAGAVYGQVLIDGKFSSIFLANQNRPDLQNALGSTRHGFTVALPILSGSQHTIQIVGLNVVPDGNGNISRPLGFQANPHAPTPANSIFNTRPVIIPITEGGTTGGGGGVISGNLAPIGFVDIVDVNHIVGWAFDVQAGALPVNVAVYVDGKFAAVGPADKNREDLTRLNLGTINHGFDILTPNNLTTGPHRVTVYALDSTTGRPTLIGSKTLQENAPLAYFIDNVPGSPQFTGYVYNPDNENTVINLEVDIDGRAVAFYPTQANLNRPDATSTTNHNHGFDITIPPLTTGFHFVQLIAYHPASGIKTVIAARNLFGDRPPIGSFAVNNQVISGYVYDDDAALDKLHYRIDVDGQRGNVFTSGTGGIGALSGPTVNTPAAPPLPSISENIFLDVTQFGARASPFANPNGQSGYAPENTFAIQTAINNVSAAGGGTVYFGAGVWESNALTLRSNVHMVLDVGAILLMITPVPPNGQPGPNFYAGDPRAFMRGTNIHNFLMSGAGTVASVGWGNNVNAPSLMRFDGSDTIEITGVEFANFSGTAINFGTALVDGKLRGTNNVTIDDIVMDFRNIFGNGRSAAITTGSIGIAPVGSNYLIKNCLRSLVTVLTDFSQEGLTTGGDTVFINSTDFYCSNIVITNNSFNRGDGITIGPNTTKGVDTVIVDNNFFFNTNFGIRIISSRGIGGVVQNVAVSNIQLGGTVRAPISVITSAGTVNSNAVTATTPLFQNFTFSDFHDSTDTNRRVARAGLTADLEGLDEQPLTGMSLYRMDFTASRGLTTFSVYGLFIAVDVAPVLPANVVFQTFRNIFQMPEDTHYFSIATPVLSPGFHNLQLYAVDPINGDNRLIRNMNLLVPATSLVNTQPVGVITGATATGVTGFAIDPDTNQPMQVEVQIDGVVQGTYTANKFQENLPIQYGPNHGFAVPLSLSRGRHVITVYGIDKTDPSVRVLLGTSVVTAGNAPGSVIQLARGDYIIATAVGFANFDPLTWVFRITVDGRTGNTIPASTLGAIVGGVATLAFKAPAVDPRVNHTISIEYIDPITLLPQTLASTTLFASPGVVGKITFGNNNVLSGFVYSTLQPEKSLTILMATDAGLVQQFDASAFVPGIGNHGFTFSTLGVPSGTHTITLYAIDPQNGIYVAFATKVVTIPAP